MIAVLGGTFDPIHFGHLRPALEIAEQFGLEQVRFIPSANPPHRWKPIASAEHRLNMVKLAIQDTPELFIVDDREYQREGSSYTVDTLQSIFDEQIKEGKEEPEPMLMILGLDAFQSFTKWREWQRILTLTHLVVSTRPGYQLQKTEEWMQGRIVDSVSGLIKKDKQGNDEFTAGCIFFSEVTQLDISATFIREQLLIGKSSSYMTPDRVVDYIRDNNLYG